MYCIVLTWVGWLTLKVTWILTSLRIKKKKKDIEPKLIAQIIRHWVLYLVSTQLIYLSRTLFLIQPILWDVLNKLKRIINSSTGYLIVFQQASRLISKVITPNAIFTTRFFSILLSFSLHLSLHVPRLVRKDKKPRDQTN